LTALFVIAAGTVFICLRASKSVGPDVKPEVLNVGTSTVTIAWLSDKSYKGRVYYKPAAGQAEPLSAVDSFGGSTQHEVVISGLSPSRRYIYRIGDSETHFQFQTQPLPATPFSFIIVWGDMSQRIVELMAAEMPEFIVSLTTPAEKGADPFTDVRPYVPIYSPQGPDSVFLRSVGQAPVSEHRNSWKLDWGGLRLVFLNEATKLKPMLNAPRAHTIGVITHPAILAASTEENSTIDPNGIAKSPAHSMLVAHNRKNPTQTAAFVGLIGQTDETAEIDDIEYFAMPVTGSGSDSGAVRIDIDVESASAFFVDQYRTVALKKPPLKQRRTCEQCRRLADKGAYEQSVKAYEEFIATHQGHFQIDDAYFAIAEIYDEKLFRFTDALTWYKRLIDEYPSGTLTPLAEQRVKHLSRYSDYDFAPLVRFERIRKIEFAKQEGLDERARLLREVDSIITEYPDCRLAATMQYWLANQYRRADADKAVDAYRKLKNKYPHHPEAQQVLMDIGQTYYQAERYKEAMGAYQEALGQLPALEDSIKAQIARCRRNIRRVHAAWVCWAVAALVITVAVFVKPVGIGVGRIAAALPGLVVLVILLWFGAWLIKEQFSSPAEMLLLVSSFAGAAAAASVFSTSLAEKVFQGHGDRSQKQGRILSAATGTVTGLILFIAALYLAIYYINIHYLIVVGM